MGSECWLKTFLPGQNWGITVGRGRCGGRKLDKSHIQCFNCQKYGYYSSDCPGKHKNHEIDARFVKFIKHEEEEMLFKVTTRDESRF